MSEAEKKKMIAGEVKKYKSFKSRILAKEAAPEAAGLVDEAADPATAAAPSKAPAGLSPESRELADYILSEVKKTIQEEFRILRQLIKNMGA